MAVPLRKLLRRPTQRTYYFAEFCIVKVNCMNIITDPNDLVSKHPNYRDIYDKSSNKIFLLKRTTSAYHHAFDYSIIVSLY